jgi:hypothetical protein
LVGILYSTISVDGQDYSNDPNNAAVLARITSNGGTGGTGGTGRTRVDDVAALTAWAASTAYTAGQFRKALNTSVTGDGPPTPPFLNTSSGQNTNLTAWYPGVVTSISPWIDLKGSINLAANVAAPSLTSSDWGNAPQFTGTLNEAMVGMSPAITAYPFTISAWVKVANGETNGGLNAFIAAISGTNSACGLFMDGTGKASAYLLQVAVADLFLTGPTINDGDWHHVALTVTSGNAATLYVDGVSQATGTAAFDPFSGANSTVIGAFRPGNNLNDPWKGYVVEARFYDSDLSASSVLAMYTLSTRWDLHGQFTGPTDIGFVTTQSGTTAASPPTWPTTAGVAVTDGTVTWRSVAEGEADAASFKGGDGAAGTAGVVVIEKAT